MSYRISVFRRGHLLAHRYELFVNDVPQFTCQMRGNVFHWEDGSRWAFDSYQGKLTDVSRDQLVLLSVPGGLRTSCFEYLSETITCTPRSAWSLSARSNQRTLFFLSKKCAYQEPWRGVVADRIPCSIPLAVILYEQYR